jgi:hypothetical protein
MAKPHHLDRDGRRRLAAEQPMPRASCPGCLVDLRPTPEQAQAGWCSSCHPKRDEVLRALLLVPDPHWRLPEWVATEIERIRGFGAEADHLRVRAESMRRHHAKTAADLRYRLAAARVCLACCEAQADYTQICPACRSEGR